jgi:hypothetical protein
MTATTYAIVGTLQGAYWMPTGQAWIKPVEYGFTRTSDPVHTSREAETLREAVERVTDDGDSSSACHLLADSVLIARRAGRTHATERVFALASFASIAADYCSPEWPKFED